MGVGSKRVAISPRTSDRVLGAPPETGFQSVTFSGGYTKYRWKTQGIIGQTIGKNPLLFVGIEDPTIYLSKRKEKKRKERYVSMVWEPVQETTRYLSLERWKSANPE